MSTRDRTSGKQPDAESSPHIEANEDRQSCEPDERTEGLTLDDVIERERARLMQADSILGCARIAMEYEESGGQGAPCIPDVLEVVRELLSTTIAKLDSLNRKKLRRECQLEEARW